MSQISVYVDKLEDIKSYIDSIISDLTVLKSNYEIMLNESSSLLSNCINLENNILEICDSFDVDIKNNNEEIKSFINTFKTYLTPSVVDSDDPEDNELVSGENEIPVLSDIVQGINDFPNTISNVIGEMSSLIMEMSDSINYIPSNILENLNKSILNLQKINDKVNNILSLTLTDDDMDYVKSFVATLDIDKALSEYYKTNHNSIFECSSNLSDISYSMQDIPEEIAQQIDNFNDYINTYFGYLDQMRRTIQATASASSGC